MAKKTALVHPDASSGRVGLIVAGMRHCVHNGYVQLVTWALSDCDRVIVALGPSRFLGYEDRATMLRAVFGPVLSFVHVEDIAADEATDDWVEYILDRVAKHELPTPTDYYTGSEVDARWYVSRFARLDDPAVSVGARTTYASDRSGKRLNILDRRASPTPAGSELGTLIQRRDPAWQAHVPAKLVRFVEQHYAPAERVAIQVADDFPADVPVGTRCVKLGESPRMIYELKPDGKWRALREAHSRVLNPGI